MSKKRAFIYGTIYVDDPQKAELTQMWIELNQHLNPDFDILIVDSQSNKSWLGLIPAMQGVPIHTVAEGDQMPPLQRGVNWIDFPENMGHLNFNNLDGWGRAFCRGIDYAIQHDYEYAVNIETDMLFGVPVSDVLGQMDAHKLNIISTDMKYTPFSHNYMENAIVFMRTSYMRQVDFVKKYDWRAQDKNAPGFEIPEQRCRTLLEPEVFYKHWNGIRRLAGAEDLKDENKIKDLVYMMHAEDQEYNYYFMRRYMPPGWQPPSWRRS